jgi:hypothetical protein
MSRPDPRVGLKALRQAFDEARFGPKRTLNLREWLPTPEVAVARAEPWLRQRQVEGVEEVLIITGRGNQSAAGFSVVRQATIRLLHSLKRRGVVAGHAEHTPGSFVVTLAPVAALWESPKRRRETSAPAAPPTPSSLEDLDEETRRMLRDLAERALEGLGIKNTETFLRGEMLRQFSAVASTIGDVPARESKLRAALRSALDQHE